MNKHTWGRLDSYLADKYMHVLKHLCCQKVYFMVLNNIYIRKYEQSFFISDYFKNSQTYEKKTTKLSSISHETQQLVLKRALILFFIINVSLWLI